MPNTEARDELRAAENRLNEIAEAMQKIEVRLVTAEGDDAEQLSEEHRKLDQQAFAVNQRIDGVPALKVPGLKHAALLEEHEELIDNVGKAQERMYAYDGVVRAAVEAARQSELAYNEALKQLQAIKAKSPGTYTAVMLLNRFRQQHPEFLQESA
jgi:hypothetical protein